MSVAPPSVRNVAYGQSGTSHAGFSTISTVVPAGAINGDLLVMAVIASAGSQTQAITPPPGWATVAISDSGLFGASGCWRFLDRITNLAVFQKVCENGDAGSTVNCIVPGTGNSQILDYENASPVGIPSPAWVLDLGQSLAQTSILAFLNFFSVETNGVALEFFGALATGPAATYTGPTTVEATTTSLDPAIRSLLACDQWWNSVGTPTMTTSVASSNLWSLIMAVPPILVPTAPIPVSPVSGAYADFTGAPTFVYQYVAQPGGGLVTGYAFRRKVGAGAYSYWNATTASWVGSIVWNTAASLVINFPSGAWANGTTYNYSVAVQASTQSLQSDFGPDVTVIGQVGPSVVVNAPTGTVTAPSLLAAWTDTLALGAVQTAYQVKAFSAAEYGAVGFDPGSSQADYDSGPIAGTAATQAIPAGFLTSGTPYRLYVIITQTGMQSSPWAYGAFTYSVDLPAVSSMTAAPFYGDDTPPLIELHVQAVDNWLSATQASATGGATTGQAAGANTTLASTVTNPEDGTHAFLLTRTGSTGPGSMSTPSGTSGFPVIPGQRVRALAGFRAPASVRTCTVTVSWWKASGAASSVRATDTSAGVADTTTGYTQAFISAIVPSDAAFCSISESVAAMAASETVEVGEVLIGPGTSTAWSLGGLNALTTATILRSDGQYVRGASPANPLAIPWPTQLASVDDADVTPGVEYSYIANIQAASFPISSPPSAATPPVSITAVDWWVFDPTDLSGSVKVQLAGDSLVQDKVQVQGIFRPIGRANPDGAGASAVVVRGDSYAREFDLPLMFYADGDTAWQAFDSLRDRGVTVAVMGDMPGDLCFVALGASRPMTLLRTSGRIPQPTRTLVIHCTPTDRPPV